MLTHHPTITLKGITTCKASTWKMCSSGAS